MKFYLGAGAFFAGLIVVLYLLFGNQAAQSPDQGAPATANEPAPMQPAPAATGGKNFNL